MFCFETCLLLMSKHTSVIGTIVSDGNAPQEYKNEELMNLVNEEMHD